MRKMCIPLILLFLGFGQKLMAQATMVDGAYTLVEQMPQYPGGADSLLAHVMAKVVYPQACADSGIQGKVYLRFIVDEKGNVTNVEAIKGPHPLLKKAALDAITDLTGFTPGTEKDKPVKVWYSLPVNFKVVEKEAAYIDTIINLNSDVGPISGASDSVGTYPEFPGGYSALFKNLSQNIQYPQLERDNGVDGKVFVSFIVDTDGWVIDPLIMHGITDGLNREAIRVVSQLPKFKPATQNGMPVQCVYNIPIAYTLLPKENGENIEDILRDTYKKSAKYIKANLQYPKWVLLQKQEVVSVVQFKFSKQGKILPIKVLNPIDSTIDREAVRVLTTLPAFSDLAYNISISKDTFAMRVEFRLDTFTSFYMGGRYLKGEPSTDYYNEMGAKYYIRHDYVRAMEYFEKASSLNANALHNIGLCYWMMYDFKKAKEMFNKSYLVGDLDAVTAIISIDELIAQDKESMQRLDSILKLDHAPQYEKGDAGLIWLISNNVTYPQIERDNDIQGTVVVTITVDKEGNVLYPHVTTGISTGLDAEALRVVSLIKKMIPAKRNGKVVQEEVKIPLIFKLT